MTQSCRATGRIVLALGCFATIGAKAETTESLAQPEVEIAAAILELRNTEAQINSAKQLGQFYGIGAQKELAQGILKTAREHFDRADFVSAIRYYRRFIEVSQTSATANFMEAYQRLGRAYQSLGDTYDAYVAYSNFLSLFVTAEKRNFSELKAVLEKFIVTVTASARDHSSVSMPLVLSSLSALDLPTKHRADVLYLLAAAAAAIGRQNLAINWLEIAEEGSQDQTLNAKIHYLKALIAISENSLEKAEEELAKSLSTAGAKHPVRNAAHLALARVSIAKNKFRLAAQYYDKVSESSALYKEALFESIFVSLKVNDAKKARARGQLFLSHFDGEIESLRVRQILSYIDMRSGSLSDAKEGIRSVNAKLRDLSQWLRQTVLSNKTLDEDTIDQMVLASEFYMQQPAIVTNALREYRRLSRAERKLSEIEGSIQNTILTAGQGSLSQLNPEWSNTIKQIGEIGGRLLKVGHRLAAVEMELHDDRLSRADRLSLESSRSRRFRLKNAKKQSQYSSRNWRELAAILDISTHIQDLNQKLQEIRAQVATARFLASEAKDTPQDEFARLEAKIVQNQSEMMLHLEKLRLAYLSRIHEVNRELGTLDHFFEYAALLHEESMIMFSYRKRIDDPGAEVTHRELQDTWKYWRHLTQSLVIHFDSTQKSIASNIQGLMSKLDEQRQRIRELRSISSTLRQTIAGTLDHHRTFVAQNFAREIDDRLSKHGKWDADIEWLEYLDRDDKQQNLAKDLRYEQQILDETLRDVRQGVLAKWPN